MFHLFLQQHLHRFVNVLRRFWQQSAYLYQLLTAIILLIDELSLLFGAVLNPRSLVLWSRWAAVWLWMVAPSYRLNIQPPSPQLFWSMFLIPLGLVLLPWLARSLACNALMNMHLWQLPPEQMRDYQLRYERAFLAFLQVFAQFEKTQRRYWELRKQGDDIATLFSQSSSTDIDEHAGLISFLYVTLSNYFFPQQPPSIILPPGEQVVEGSILAQSLPPDQPQPMVPLSSFIHSGVQAEAHLYLFGDLRIQLVGADEQDIPLKSARQRELLAYLAIHAKEHTTYWTHLVTNIYEGYASDKDSDLLHHHLNNDVKELRTLFKNQFRQIERPYVDPISVKGRGPNAVWRLASSYIVVDITALEDIAAKMSKAKQEPPADIWALRAAYEAVLQSYGDGLLGQQRREQQVGEWIKPYVARYGKMYLQLLWDVAEYEFARGTSNQYDDRRESLRQAAQCYEKHAFLTMPASSEEFNPDGNAKLSEYTLRQCVTCYGHLGDVLSARRVYHRYIEVMKRRHSEWQPNPQTMQAFDDAVRMSGKE